MPRTIKRTDLPNGFTVSTVELEPGRFESMGFDASGEEFAAWRPANERMAKAAHRELVGLAKLGSLAAYYAGSAGTSTVRACIEGRTRTIRAGA